MEECEGGVIMLNWIYMGNGLVGAFEFLAYRRLQKLSIIEAG